MELGILLRIVFVKIFSKFFPSKKSKIILYHDLYGKRSYTDMATSIELFKIHINIIKNEGFEIVPEITKGTGQIQITFDDAFLGIYDNFNVIEDLNIPIKLFVVTSFFNKDNYLNEEQLKKIASSKLISIGSHTHTHKRLYDLTNSEIEYELSYSKKLLEELLLCEVTDLCYPEGKFDGRVIGIAKKLAYRKQFSLIPGEFNDEVFPNVKRRNLVQDADSSYFRAILYGGNNFLSFWYMKKHFKI